MAPKLVLALQSVRDQMLRLVEVLPSVRVQVKV